jgi:hypothetical protein
MVLSTDNISQANEPQTHLTIIGLPVITEIFFLNTFIYRTSVCKTIEALWKLELRYCRILKIMSPDLSKISLFLDNGVIVR